MKQQKETRQGNRISTNERARACKKLPLLLLVNIVVLCITVIAIYVLVVEFYRLNDKYRIQPMKKRDFYLKFFLPCEDKQLRRSVRQYDRYWILENYFIGVKAEHIPCSATVTYCTHGRDLSFFKHLPSLAASSYTPISAALYAPGSDFVEILSAIQHVRHCLLESSIIRDWVSFHIVIPQAHMPEDIYLGNLNFTHWSVDCNNSVRHQDWNYTASYAYRQKLPYPVNILRNLARRASNTYFYMNAEVTFTPTSAAGWDDFLDTMYKTICKNYHKPHEEPLIHCGHMNAKKNILTNLHMQLVGETNDRIIYEVLEFKTTLGTMTPESLDQIVQLDKEGKGRITKSIDPNFIAEPTIPFFDERIYWHTNTRHHHMQTYVMCLLNTIMYSLNSIFLVQHNDRDKRVYSNNEVFIKEASYLNSSILQNEYANLYGSKHKEKCRQCFYRYKLCL